MKPFPAELIRMLPISTRVNKPEMMIPILNRLSYVPYKRLN